MVARVACEGAARWLAHRMSALLQLGVSWGCRPARFYVFTLLLRIRSAPPQGFERQRGGQVASPSQIRIEVHITVPS